MIQSSLWRSLSLVAILAAGALLLTQFVLSPVLSWIPHHVSLRYLQEHGYQLASAVSVFSTLAILAVIGTAAGRFAPHHPALHAIISMVILSALSFVFVPPRGFHPLVRVASYVLQIAIAGSFAAVTAHRKVSPKTTDAPVAQGPSK